jgi:hypothetical protein
MARVCHLVGPGGLPETGLSLFRPFGLHAAGARLQMLRSHLFEPPISTMSRPIGRTKPRVDSSKLVVSNYEINHSQGLNRIDGALFVTRPAVKARRASKIRMQEWGKICSDLSFIWSDCVLFL